MVISLYRIRSRSCFAFRISNVVPLSHSLCRSRHHGAILHVLLADGENRGFPVLWVEAGDDNFDEELLGLALRDGRVYVLGRHFGLGENVDLLHAYKGTSSSAGVLQCPGKDVRRRRGGEGRSKDEMQRLDLDEARWLDDQIVLVVSDLFGHSSATRNSSTLACCARALKTWSIARMAAFDT